MALVAVTLAASAGCVPGTVDDGATVVATAEASLGAAAQAPESASADAADTTAGTGAASSSGERYRVVDPGTGEAVVREDAPAPPAPAYAAAVTPITPELAARMHASWRPGCPVPLEDLRYVTVTHHDMAGGVATGELVVHADVAAGLVEVFRTLFDAGFPIASMRLVDDFGADDDASMAADNTSAFNCRAVTGGSSWSEHSYGRAIDVNPVENPYVRGSTVLPPAGAAFVGRPVAPGVILDGDVVVQAFAAHGWQWGGHWTSPKDYQHFSTTGR